MERKRREGNGTKLRPFLDNLATDGTDFTNSRGKLRLIRAYPCNPWFDSLRLRFSAQNPLLLKLPHLSAILVESVIIIHGQGAHRYAWIV